MHFRFAFALRSLQELFFSPLTISNGNHLLYFFVPSDRSVHTDKEVPTKTSVARFVTLKKNFEKFDTPFRSSIHPPRFFPHRIFRGEIFLCRIRIRSL